MRAFASLLRGRIAVALAILAVACDGGPTANGGVRRLELEVPASTLRPGFVVQAQAIPLDANGEVVEGRVVSWRSLTPQTLAVSSEGLLLALAPGTGIARASIGSVSAEVTLDLVNPPVAALTLDADTVRLSLPGGGRTLVATARDADGIGILGVPITWESSAARIAAVSASGVVSAQAVGVARVSVRAEALVATAVVDVSAPVTPGGPLITGFAPTAVGPGQVLAITGSNFGPTPSANSVMIDGTPVIVTSATATQLIVALPAASAFACEPTRTVAVQLTTSVGIGVAPITLSVATRRTLSIGQSLAFSTLNESRCNEFSPDGGRYVVTVQNAARAIGAGPVALTLNGAATPAAGAPLLAPSTVPSDVRSAPPRAPGLLTGPALQLGGGGDARQARRARAHRGIMEANAALLAGARPELRAGPDGARLSTPLPGAVLPVRIANLGSTNFCSSFTAIGARAVFVGDRVVILEDTIPTFNGQPTLRGQMDNLYVALGAELEGTTWPILGVFGDPLVMDSRLDANGRVFLVFSPQMNQQLGGSVLAAVVNCDYFPRAQFGSSNVGEFVYAQVPTSAAAGFGEGTRSRWFHEIRATLAHELKHVTSFSERIVRGQPLEEPWLEEATARHAEELFARVVYGTPRDGNHGFTATLACELGASNPALTACAGAPRAMLPHFDALWDFLAASTSSSPLGPTAPGDFSFYGSAWALTRWILDQQGLDEPAFFTALTRSGQAGIANLEARVGRSWDEMLGEWSLAMATDGRAGLVTASPRVRFPSWDLTDVYAGLCSAIGACGATPASPLRYTRPYPAAPALLSAGAFAHEIPSLAPGGFAVMEVAPPAAGLRQLIALGGFRGAALPATLRLAILRIE